MRRILLFIALLTGSATLAAQEMEAGEWQFDAVMTSPLLPKPQTSSFNRCVKKEDAGDPSRMMGRQEQQTDCKVTQAKKSSGTYTWEMTCPKSGLQGQGTARYGRGTLQSEVHMTGELQGRKIDMTTKTTGKRLGPCKS
jgi:hypothetical protein